MINRGLQFVLLLVLSLSLGAQDIKKMKVSDLAAYIRECGHPLIVNFWATTCEPCIKEIPYLQRIALDYQREKVELLLVSLDMPSCYPLKLFSFAKEKSIKTTIIYPEADNAGGHFYRQFDPSWSGGIPASLFINNQTHYRKFFDRQLTEKQVEWYLKEIIKE